MKRTIKLPVTLKLTLVCVACLVVEGAFRLSLGDTGAAVTIRLTGCRIKPADQVTLSVNQSGVLDSVPREGDRVEAGQRVILLEDELARATLAVAEKEAANDVDLRHSEIASDAARLEHEQTIQINELSQGAITLTETRRAKLGFDRSLLQIEQAKHKQAIAVLKRDETAAQLKTFYVTAPFLGTVNKVLKHKGETVRQGEPVLELVNTRRVRVEGFLDVAHRRRVTPGTAVQVEPETRADGSVAAPATGKIVFIDSVVQPVTQQVRIWADVENTDELLLPGLTAVMSITPSSPPVAASRR